MEVTETAIGEVNNITRKKYEIDGNPIQVSWKEFVPSGEKTAVPGRVVMFFPGWSMGESVKSAKDLNQSFADVSGGQTLSVTSRPDSVIPDSLFRESEAIAQFIDELGAREVTLVGHSEGGIKAVDVATILQDKYSDIKVRGVILLDSVGLYEQGNWELAGKFVKDSIVDTLRNNLADQSRKKTQDEQPLSGLKKAKTLLTRAKNTLGAGNDIAGGMIKEAVLSHVNYPKRLVSQVQEMTRENPRVKKLRIPVILINGAKDPVSSKKRIIPEAEEEKAIQDYLLANNLDSEKVDPTLRAREAYLKDSLFPNSPYIRMIVPEKFGNHGLPLFRPKSVGNVALGLLDRFYGTHRGVPTVNQS